MRDLKIFSTQKQTDRSVIAVIVFFQKKKKIFLRWFKIIAQYTVYIHDSVWSTQFQGVNYIAWIVKSGENELHVPFYRNEWRNHERCHDTNPSKAVNV